MNIINECLVDVFNEYSPTKLPKFKTNLKNLLNMLRAKLHRNRSIIEISFSFLFLCQDLRKIKLMYNNLVKAVNYSRKFVSVKPQAATPKYMRKSW